MVWQKSFPAPPCLRVHSVSPRAVGLDEVDVARAGAERPGPSADDEAGVGGRGDRVALLLARAAERPRPQRIAGGSGANDVDVALARAKGESGTDDDEAGVRALGDGVADVVGTAAIRPGP